MLASIIRTVVPVVVGIILGQAARVGLDLDPGAVTSIVTAAATTVYYALGRFVETEFPAAGRWLLAAGLTKETPAYIRH